MRHERHLYVFTLDSDNKESRSLSWFDMRECNLIPTRKSVSLLVSKYCLLTTLDSGYYINHVILKEQNIKKRFHWNAYLCPIYVGVSRLLRFIGVSIAIIKIIWRLSSADVQRCYSLLCYLPDLFIHGCDIVEICDGIIVI